MEYLKGDGQSSLNKLVNFLSKDYEATVSDFKNIGKSVTKERVKAGCTVALMTAFAAASIGCPWDKRDHDDTTSGSSGTPKVNHAPVLEKLIDTGFDDTVEPNVGEAAATNIEFGVNYEDEDNDAPVTMTAIAKNALGVETEIPMTLGTNPVTSTYITGKKLKAITSTLPAGIYTVGFRVSDGDKTATLPFANHLIVLPTAAYNALMTRLGRAQIYLNGAGKEAATYPNATGESDTVHKLIRDADANDVIVLKALKSDYDAEQRIEVIEAHLTSTLYTQMRKALSASNIDGITAAQTSEIIPGLEVKVLNLEVPFQKYSRKLDALNKKGRDSLEDENGNLINFTWDYNDQELANQKDFITIALATSYLNNLDKGYTIILPSKEQDTPFTPR